jgi:predicted transcriptional regulator of viral defense system
MGAKRQLGTFDTASFLAKNPVFALGDLRGALGGVRNRSAALERVKYYLKRGKLKPVSRGVYATVPVGVDAAAFKPDRFLVAAAVRSDAVFSHHAALELLGSAHSDWNVCSAFTESRHAPIAVDSVKLLFLRDPPALRKGDLRHLGARRTDRQGRTLWATGPERTLLDGFRQPRLLGGLTELVESARGFGVLDLDLLTKLLAAYDQKILYAAVGWFLEMTRLQFSVPEHFLAGLEKQRPRSRHYLPRGNRRGGVLAPRWNLVLPDELVRGKEPDES